MDLINKNLSLYKKNLFQGEVIKIEEGIDSGIIYVRIPEIDQNIANNDLSPCYPVNNFQFLRILPKKGERVFVVMDRLLENTDQSVKLTLDTGHMLFAQGNSKKILEGSIDEVKEARSGNEFRVTYQGDHMAFAKALWIDAELKETKTIRNNLHSSTIKIANKKTPNDLLKAVIPHVDVLGLEKVIPSMNDVFIDRVNEINQSDFVLDLIQNLIDNAHTKNNSKGGIGLSKSRIQ